MPDMPPKEGSEVAGPSPSKINKLMAVASQQTAGPKQQQLDLVITKQAEFEGLEMGVLSDGTPYLTGRSLATLCDVHHKVIQDVTTEWNDPTPRGRVDAIRAILQSRGLSFDKLYVKSWQKGNATFFAYPDSVCLAILEYYAFEAKESREKAVANFRALAGHALREFIYVHVGYDPNAHVPVIWKQFHDRVSLVYKAVPDGYFGIFKEIAEMIVTLGQAGLHIDDSFVPDISVGMAWAKHWTSNEYDTHYSVRIKFDHRYPDYFPQSVSNPQEAWCYPEAALGEFRRWFRETYIGDGKFETYLLGKVKDKALPASFAHLAIAAYKGEKQ